MTAELTRSPAPGRTVGMLACAHRLRADARADVARSGRLDAHLELLLTDVAFGDVPRPELLRAWERVRGLLGTTRGLGPWLYGGAAQVGWVAHALGVPAPAAVDAAVLGWIAQFPADGDVDLPRGVLGLGVYALRHPDAAFRQRATAGVLDVVAARAEHDRNGLFVRVPDAPPHRRMGTVGHRLVGACHGAAGLVSYLAAAAGSGLDCAPRAARLLTAAAAWLVAQHARVGDSEFPRSVETRDVATRSAWCHGDPGVWVGLSVAAGRLERRGDPRPAAATRAAAAALVTLPPATAGVLDASLCHGAAGLAWVGCRIAAADGSGAPSAAARAFAASWASRIVAERAAGRLRYVVGAGSTAPDASLLGGDLGVALALRHLVGPAGPPGYRPRVWEPLLLAEPPVPAGTG